MSQCKIYLENYSGTYYAGSEIRGRLECYFDDETTVRGIKIRVRGREHNEWTGTETYRDPIDHKTKTRHITLTGDNNVLYLEQMLFGSASGTRVIPRGRHVYPFSCHLPYDIPSTFNGPHGSISYKIKAIVDRPMRVDHEDEFIFVLVSPIDFNKMSRDLQDITTYSDEKSVCCWCCKGGDVTMDVELPKIAFVPGETIHFKVTITNLSNSNVENLKVKFVKTVKYRVTSPHSESKEDVDNILNFTDHGVGAHGEHTFNLQLAIPEFVEVPNFTKCELFKVSYALEVSAEMAGCTLDLDISVWDIQMGHIQCTDYGESGDANRAPLPGGKFPLPPTSPYPPAAGEGYSPGGLYPPNSGGVYPPSPGGGYPLPPGGAYPPGGVYPPPAGGTYPPPPGGTYPPPPGGAYPPPAGGAYPPPAGGAYPPPAGGTYPPSPGGAYPPSGPGAYPPPAGAAYPATPGGAYSDPPNYSATTEKTAPPGPPSAPSSSIASAPFDNNPKAREAAASAAHNAAPELPPPSYNEIQKNANAPYPPQ
jgi:hypothetical protein